MLEKRAAKGLPTPALDRRPEVPEHLLLPWSMFLELSAMRIANQIGPQPVSLVEFTHWCELHAVSSVTLRRYMFKLLRAMDRAYISQFHAKMSRRRSDTKHGSRVPKDRP